MTAKIRITKPGYDVTTTDLRGVLLDSEYSMFKYHMDQSKSMTINAGDTEKTVSFAHGLDHVPAYIAYLDFGDTITPLPRRDVYISGLDRAWFSYADDTNIYLKWRSKIPYNQSNIYASDYWNTYDDDEDHFSVGRISNNPFDGAFRFTNVAITGADTLVSAYIQSYVTMKDGSGFIKFKTYGIDEDNTGSFSNPMGRTKTTAYSSTTRSVPTNNGDYVEIDVKNAMLEIADRGGWSTGNAMGFIINENTGDEDAWFRSDSNTYLSYIKSGSVTYNFRVIVFKDKIE